MERKEKTILITLIANIILIILRFSLANLSGSIGLAANAWHSFTDVFVTSVVLLGLLVARLGAKKLKKVTQKAENILAIFVSLFIFYMGVEILADAMGNDGIELKHVPFVAAGAFVGVIINYFMARYKIYVGNQTGSQSLIADGYHSKMDMYCSIAVFVGLLGSLFGMSSLDKIAAIIAMVLMLIAGYEIFMSNIKILLHPQESSEDHHHHVPFKGSKKMYVMAGSVLVAAYLLSGVYFVKWDEVGIVQRFGAVVNADASPGIHYRLPFPFEEVTLVKKDNVQKISTESQELLTGDTNLLNVNISVHYKVANAKDYAMNVNNLDSLIRAGATTSIRTIVGRETIDYLLTEGKSDVEQQAKSLLQAVMNKNNTGIEVVGVQLLESAPPDSVKASFQDLASARQDRAIYINEAMAYKNTILPKANADAYTQVSQAEAYKIEKIKTAEGDAALFKERQAAYAASKSVTEFRLYMESMDKILPNVQKILLGANIKIDNAELWISNKNNITGGNE
ncbi:MAG: FtsH protease activity modulator HflK [Eubacteriales bacterium]|nr:FtsH protease activity modulator HflK [Eubacteriales bacterium]